MCDKVTTVEFRNELIDRLNNNASRCHGGICNGKYFPEVETFDVDEVYEIIDRIYFNQPEDNNESE